MKITVKDDSDRLFEYYNGVARKLNITLEHAKLYVGSDYCLYRSDLSFPRKVVDEDS